MPETQYARTPDGTHIAYQVVGGDGPDLLVVWGFMSHVELGNQHPGISRMFRRLAGFSRVIYFDKRGMGLSDPVSRPPTLEERVEDMVAVLDAAGSERAHLFGLSEGGPASVLFAATYPERTAGLILYGAMARSTESDDHPWAAPADVLRAANKEMIAPHWGEGVLLETFAPSDADDPVAREWQSRMERHAAPPGVVRDLFELFLEIDIRDLLPHVQVPALLLHRSGDRAVNVRASRWMAERLPDAEYVELPGIDHQIWSGDDAAVYDEIERFVTGATPRPAVERSLQTVMFTDIVESTGLASELGDRRWRELMDRHDQMAEEEVGRYGGRLVKMLGDGMLATFDGPARALRCARELVERAPGLGLQLRIGIHTGECEVVRGDDLAGIAVHIAARVVAEAPPGEILVTDTVRTLVIGSELRFQDRGRQALRGIPGEWSLAALEFD